MASCFCHFFQFTVCTFLWVSIGLLFYWNIRLWNFKLLTFNWTIIIQKRLTILIVFQVFCEHVWVSRFRRFSFDRFFKICVFRTYLIILLLNLSCWFFPSCNFNWMQISYFQWFYFLSSGIWGYWFCIIFWW